MKCLQCYLVLNSRGIKEYQVFVIAPALYTKQYPVPKPYNAQLPVLSDWMARRNLGNVLRRKSCVQCREKGEGAVQH